MWRGGREREKGRKEMKDDEPLKKRVGLLLWNVFDVARYLFQHSDMKGREQREGGRERKRDKSLFFFFISSSIFLFYLLF